MLRTKFSLVLISSSVVPYDQNCNYLIRLAGTGCGTNRPQRKQDICECLLKSARTSNCGGTSLSMNVGPRGRTLLLTKMGACKLLD